MSFWESKEKKWTCGQTWSRSGRRPKLHDGTSLPSTTSLGGTKPDMLSQFNSRFEIHVALFLKLKKLFVFTINGPKQNARSLLTPVSDTDFYALLHSSQHVVIHGSPNNYLFQWFWRFSANKKMFKKSYHGEQNQGYYVKEHKTVSETGVKSDLASCLGSPNEKTNSEFQCEEFKTQNFQRIKILLKFLHKLKLSKTKGWNSKLTLPEDFSAPERPSDVKTKSLD